MTEAQWLASDDRRALVGHVAGAPAVKADPARRGALDRKLQLLAVACVRRVARHLTERGWAALALAERAADETVPAAEREAAAADLGDGSLRPRRRRKLDNIFSADDRVEHATGGLIHLLVEPDGVPVEAVVRQFMAAQQAVLVAEIGGTGGAERAAQAALARDVFGNPFRPVTLDPAWRTSTVVALARSIYDERAFDRLPILADALQDAGCANDDVLEHCRGPGPHVRGCWVVDLVLGKG
jgi:hypothetical protein